MQFAERRAKRKTKVQPSQTDRSKPAPVRHPRRGAYSAHAYSRAIDRAAKLAGVPSWHPNQLRHLVGTEVRAKYGLEAAQNVLGHARADVTQVYAERDQGKAAQVAAEIG